jgi:acyl carrier protein
MITIQEFIEKFGEQFDDTDISQIKPETEFKALDEWSSLIALSVMAMVDEEYEVSLKGDDIRNSKTIEDLYNIVVSRKQNEQ